MDKKLDTRLPCNKCLMFEKENLKLLKDEDAVNIICCGTSNPTVPCMFWRLDD